MGSPWRMYSELCSPQARASRASFRNAYSDGDDEALPVAVHWEKKISLINFLSSFVSETIGIVGIHAC